MSVRLSVCLSVCPSCLGGNVIFKGYNYYKGPIFCEHLFYKYVVRQYVGQATKGKRASLLMDVVILVNCTKWYFTFVKLSFI